MKMTPEQYRLRAQIAARARFYDHDDEDLAHARRAYRANRIEHRLRRDLAQQPALTRTQREQIAAVLLDPDVPAA